jgi:hypothetical protein
MKLPFESNWENGSPTLGRSTIYSQDWAKPASAIESIRSSCRYAKNARRVIDVPAVAHSAFFPNEFNLDG